MQQSTLAVWKNIDPSIQVKEWSVADLEAIIAQGEQIKTEMSVLQAQMTDLRNRRDALYVSGWNIIKHLRYWIKGHYGDDSSEYEMVGGTRLSERKPRSSRKRAAAPGADQTETQSSSSQPG